MIEDYLKKLTTVGSVMTRRTDTKLWLIDFYSYDSLETQTLLGEDLEVILAGLTEVYYE